jgi:hypothetical protein
MRFDQILLDVVRDLFVAAEIQGKLAFSGGDGLETSLEARDLGERKLPHNGDAISGEVGVSGDLATLGGEISGDISQAVARGQDLQIYNGLKNHGTGLLDGIQKGLTSGGDEGDLFGIYGVVLAVIDGHSHVTHGVARNGTLIEGFLDTLLNSRNELARDDTAGDVVDEFESRAPGEGFDFEVDLTELPGTAGLLAVAMMSLGRFGDGLPVGDAGLVGVDLDVESLGHALQKHPKMEGSEAVNDGLVGTCILLNADAEIFFCKLVQGVGELGLIATFLDLNR